MMATTANHRIPSVHGMLIGLLSLALAVTPAMAMGSGPDEPAPGAPTAAPIGGTVEGKVVGVQDGTLVVETTGGETVRLLTTATTKQERRFDVGDEIEAVMSPEGVATSIHLRKKAFKR